MSNSGTVSFLLHILSQTFTELDRVNTELSLLQQNLPSPPRLSSIAAPSTSTCLAESGGSSDIEVDNRSISSRSLAMLHLIENLTTEGRRKVAAFCLGDTTSLSTPCGPTKSSSSLASSETYHELKSERLARLDEQVSEIAKQIADLRASPSDTGFYDAVPAMKLFRVPHRKGKQAIERGDSITTSDTESTDAVDTAKLFTVPRGKQATEAEKQACKGKNPHPSLNFIEKIRPAADSPRLYPTLESVLAEGNMQTPTGASWFEATAKANRTQVSAVASSP